MMKKLIYISLFLLLLSCEEEVQFSDEDIIVTDESGRILSEDIPEQFTPRCETADSIICVRPAFPNPYINFSDIVIEAKSSGVLSLSLFDGKSRVFAINNGVIPSGISQYEIPSFDERGKDLSPGIYEVKYTFRSGESVVSGFGSVELR
jgi:hypothetical protein